MRQQKKSLTAAAKDKTTQNGLLTQPSTSQEIYNLMRETEAMDWLERYREKAYEHGKTAARLWWLKTISDIERIRGKEAADDLRNRMNRIQNDLRSHI